MHIVRYDRNFARREFIKRSAAGFIGTGLLGSLWDAVAASGDASQAYPQELRSIEDYTRGRLKAGDIITADNVEFVSELLDPIKREQITKLGRRLRLVPSTTDIMRLSPWEYVEATLRNRGKAKLDSRGNVVTADGQPWIGGHPFPGSSDALQLFAGLTLSWGRHDGSFYAIKEYDLSPQGKVAYEYELGWAELSPVARVSSDPRPYWPQHQDKLRFQSVFFNRPDNVRGTSFLNVWPYDQSSFPLLQGYVPAFKRVRQFPTDQRFEPLVAGSTLYLSDAWCAGDPLYTWGNYRVIGRGPMLAAVSGAWNSKHPNWEHGVHGGPNGQTFWNTDVELVPEAIIVEAEPVKFPRAPVSKKRVWFDARTQLPIGMVTFDRRGEPYHSFDGAYGLYDSAGGASIKDGAHAYWSWGHLHAFDVQTGRMTRLEQVKEIAGGHKSAPNDPAMYERYLTTAALMRIGGA